MSADNTELGRCPHCKERVPAEEMVIDYQTGEGTRITAAKCPECVAFVTLV